MALRLVLKLWGKKVFGPDGIDLLAALRSKCNSQKAKVSSKWAKSITFCKILPVCAFAAHFLFS